MSDRPHPTRRLKLLTVAAATVLSLLAFVAPAMALTIEEFAGRLGDDAGTNVVQAGAHPNFETRIAFPVEGNQVGGSQAEDNEKDLEVALPPGFVGDPSAAPTCPLKNMAAGQAAAPFPQCSVASQVGIADVYFTYFPNFPALFHEPVPVYNIDPPAGVPARFAFNEGGVVVVIDAAVRTGGDYGVTSKVSDVSQGIPVVRSFVKLFGVPADPANNDERFFEGTYRTGAEPEGPRKPFITLPTRCADQLSFSLRTRSWLEPENWLTASFDHDPDGNALRTRGCETLPFDPQVRVSVGEDRADTPTGLDFSLTLPQNTDPAGNATANLKSATISLPEGMAVNPAAAGGLKGCSPTQIGLENDSPAQCPDASKIGEVRIETPLLPEPMEGSAYLAEQSHNPFGSTLAMYLVAEGSGVVIKVPGKIDPDPETGRLVTSFDDNPQLPFERLNVEFDDGPRAPLLTPPTCGTYAVGASFTSWAQPLVKVARSSSFTLGHGPGGGSCPSPNGFSPSFEAGTTSPIAGAYAPLVAKVSRPDGSGTLSGFSLKLPHGLLGKLAGIPYCPQAALEAAAGKSGAAEQANPSCPAASEVGSADVAVGAGPNPYYAKARIYLAGPYKGVPLSFAAVTPAVAGPFDLGTVVVRNAVSVDPVTSQIGVVSDRIPTILQGIPLHVRSVVINADRPGFTLNPTNCAPMAFAGSLLSPAASISVSSPFQVANCERLAFKPDLKLSVKGPTHRNAHPALKAVLTMPNQGANIQKAQVTLPKTELLENAHIRTICTRVQYAAGAGGGSQCPPASIYGRAKAWSPLLDKPLEGPVYLRSSSHQLPDLVASLNGQIHIDLVGRIDAVNARIRNTFEAVPDAPVSRFVLQMQGGRKGLLANNTELCRTTPRASVAFDAQNGKAADSDPVMRADCGKKARKGAGKHSAKH